jgi:hypothetical protein
VSKPPSVDLDADSDVDENVYVSDPRLTVPDLECLGAHFDIETCNMFERPSKRATKAAKRAAEERFHLLAIDIEGMDDNILEVAWIMWQPKTGYTKAGIRHIQPLYERKVKEEARHSHGINVAELRSMEVHRECFVWEEIKSIAVSRPGTLIISADLQGKSDVSKKVRNWNIPYHNVPLPNWNIRMGQHAHKVTQLLKRTGVINYEGASCPYKQLHSVILDRFMTGRESGPYCALTDVFELRQHIEDNNMQEGLRKIQIYEAEKIALATRTCVDFKAGADFF